MKWPRINWKKTRRVAAVMCGVLLLLIVFVSHRFVHLTHQHFGVLAELQRKPGSTSQRESDPPEVIGHRGSGVRSLDYEDTQLLIGNTRGAISAAIETADWIEIDVRTARGGELFVFHDERVGEKTNAHGDPKLEELDADGVQELTVSVPMFAGQPEKILTLDQVLSEFREEKPRWILDIKSSGIVDDVVRALNQQKVTADRVILFGDHDILRKYGDTGFRRGYTTLWHNHRHMLYSYATVLQRCEDEAYDYLVVPAVLVTPRLAAECASRDLPLWVYGTNDLRDLEHCVNCGVEGLIVDFPEQVARHFGTPRARGASSNEGDRRVEGPTEAQADDQADTDVRP